MTTPSLTPEELACAVTLADVWVAPLPADRLLCAAVLDLAAERDRLIVERDALAGLLAELYRDTGGAWRSCEAAYPRAERCDVATCDPCALDERIEAALRAAGLQAPASWGVGGTIGGEL